MRTLLAPAHLALTVIILTWNIVLAGRMAQNRQSPRVFQAICGLAALLVLPGLLLTLATSTIITGRAVVLMDWLWPVVLVLFAAQAIYALVRRMVNPLWGIPIAVYDLMIAVIGVIRYMIAHGNAGAEPFAVLLGAQSIAMVFAGGTASVLETPFYLNMPMISPAFPALHELTASFRLVMSLIALMWVLFIGVLGFPRAVVQLRNYQVHAHDQLRERPDADFSVGLKILPDMLTPPPVAAVRSDSALVNSMEVDAVAVVVVPGASRAAIDSLARVLDPARRDSTLLIVALGYRGKLLPELGKAPLNQEERLATLRQVVARLHPDVVLPAEDPYGSGARAVGELSPGEWQAYLRQAARVARSVDRGVHIGVAASSYTSNDSALYAWAASPASPI